MTKLNWITSVIVGVIIGVIVFLANTVDKNTVSAQVSDELNPIFNLMLNSASTWKTLKGEATITFFSRDGSSQKFQNEFEFAFPYRAYIESVEDGNPNNKTIWISDGESYYLLEFQGDKFFENSIPAFAKDLSQEPVPADQIGGDESYDHPFSLIITLPIKEYIFPAGFTQGAGDYTLKGDDEVIGRKAWVIVFTVFDNDRKTDNDVTSTFWVDKETGIVLKNIVTRPDYKGGIGYEVLFTTLEVDGEVDPVKMKKPDGYNFAPFAP